MNLHLEPPSFCPTGLVMLCFHFHSILKVLISFLTSVLIYFSFSSDLFSFYAFVCFLLLITSFNPWWSARMQDIISLSFYLLRLALCLSLCPVLEKAPWAAQKKVYILVFGWISASPFGLWHQLAPASLFSFCLEHLSPMIIM